MSVRTVGQILIEQGEDFEKTFKLRTDGGYTAIDLSSASSFTFALEKNDGTWLTLNSDDNASSVDILGTGAAGDVKLTLTQAQTATLKKGKNQNIEMSYEDADSKKRVVILEKILTVVEPEGIVYSA